jgi:hypothetical protein
MPTQYTVTETFEPFADSRLEALKAALVRKVDSVDAQLQMRIVENLSGQVLQIRTGKAARSVEMIPARVVGNTITGAVQAGGGAAFYLKFQEDGTKPYEIVPVRAKVLAFQVQGRQIFTKRVKHPGLPARRPVGQAVDAFRDSMVAQLQATPFEVGA